MDIFEHNGKQFISISGKDYFLIKGYRKNRDNFIFIQVFGKTPLHKEDLPSKEWEIVQSKAGTERIWTAYQKKYFKYDTQASEPTLVFIGASTEGSYFIALLNICKRLNLEIKTDELKQLSGRFAIGEVESHHLDKLSDEGNSGVDAVLITFNSFFEEKDAQQLIKEDVSNG